MRALKDAVTSFDVRALALELAGLSGAVLDKVYQRGIEEVAFRFRGAREGRVDLVVAPGRFAYLTKAAREYPPEPPPFAAGLRRHLAGARIAGAAQAGFDRVVEITLARAAGDLLLVVELFHDGNVIVVRDGRILACLTSQAFAHRTVRPGAGYERPPARLDPFTLAREDFEARVRAGGTDAVRTLAVELNLGGPYAEEVCARAHVDKGRPASLLGDAEVAALWDGLQALLAPFREGRLEPVVVEGPAGAVDAAPVRLVTFAAGDVRPAESMSAALERVFGAGQAAPDEAAAANEKERQRLERQRATQLAAVARFGEEDRKAREAGDLLYGRFQEADALLAKARDLVESAGWDALKSAVAAGKEAKEAWALAIETQDPATGRLGVRLPGPDGKPRKMTLDVTLDVAANAALQYEAAKKVREKTPGALAAIGRTEAALARLAARGAKHAAKAAERKRGRPAGRRFWFETYRWFLARAGNLVVAGRDARTNERLVKDHLEEKDRYCHADLHGAPSVVVKHPPEPSPETLAEACAFALAYSKAWAAGHAAGTAYWVMPAQVSKTPESGEYLARGAFVIRGKRNHVQVQVRAAVGDVEVEGSPKIMGGPPESVRARAKRLVVLEPGEEDANLLARRLSRAFGVAVEEVQRALPPGPCRVVESQGLSWEGAA